MSDPPPPPPRVSVTLPEVGRTMSARLLRWHQAPDGTWQPVVALTVPARAVTPVQGEDYSQVPRERAGPPAPAWVIAPIGRAPDAPHEVHDAARCWLVHGGRTVTRDEARAAIAQGAPACAVCRPEP